MQPSLIELLDISNQTLTNFHPIFKKPVFSYKITQILMYVFVTTGLFFILTQFVNQKQLQLETTDIEDVETITFQQSYFKESSKEVLFCVILMFPVVVGVFLI